MASCNPEQAVIGVCAYAPEYLPYAIQRLTAEDFQDAALAAAFDEMRRRYLAQGRFVAGDVSLLTQRQTVEYCKAIVPTVSYGRRYIDAVRDAAIRRKAAILGLEIAAEGKTTAQLMEASTALSELLTETANDDRVQDMATVMGRWLVEQNDPEDHSIKTGLGPVDRCCNIRAGHMVVIGGRPSAGKTALGLQIGLYMASHGHTVCFFSYETSQQGLADKLMSNYAHIPQDEIVFKRRAPQDAEYAKAADELSRLPFYLVNAGGKGAAWCATVAAARNADVLIFDYMQLMPAKGSSRYEQVTNISMALHTLAQTSGKLVVALAQIGRSGAGRPTMNDLKESGQIEQDADAIILLARNKSDGEDEYSFELAKNKRGITGAMDITFDGVYQTFYEVVDR